jgi:RHS repeat-associated protein
MNDSDGAPHFYSYDGLGSVVEMSALNGDQEWSYSYDAFGEAKSTEKVALLAPPNPMRFTGEYLDPTGLYHLRARQYDPSLGRFTATDPVSPAIHDPYVSAYAYVNNQPTVYVDPSGEIAIAIPIVIGLVGLAGLLATTPPEVSADVASDMAYDVGQFFDGVFGGTTSTVLGETLPCDGWAQGAFARGIEPHPGPPALNKVVARQLAPVEQGGNKFGRRSGWCKAHPVKCAAVVGGTVGSFGVYEVLPRKPAP